MPPGQEQPRTKPETLRARAVTPGFTVNDLERSIRFYTEGLGFIVDERMEHEGKMYGVMLRAGGSILGLFQDDFAKGKNRVKGVAMRLWISTAQDVDELAARARAAGITLDDGPKDMPWGPRAFEVTDPDGFKLTIARQL